MSDKQETATSEGIVGQSVSTGGLERRIFDLWNQAVTEVGDCTYPHIILRFSELVAADEREACANVVEDFEGDCGYGKEQNIADEIRMRSNVELRGAEQASLAERPSPTPGSAAPEPSSGD